MKRAFAWLLVPCLLACQTTNTTPDKLISSLSRIIERELAAKGIPAFSIALVDDQEIVWAEGFGDADPDAGIPATAETVYRVGSVSKLFTDIAIMQLVERGKLDLDVDVRDYLPELELDNPFRGTVTLRQLMSHRSGLIREPPLGNYFDPSEPTLAATIDSLNEARLVYEPGARFKYSNAGIAIVGYVLERMEKTPFADYVRAHVIDPLGMEHSDFGVSARVRYDVAKGLMWTYDGRTFEAPTFQLGIAPAGSLYSSVNDLARFTSALFRGGGGVVRGETLDSMYAPQFTEHDPNATYGLGFSTSELDGHRLVGHGGAIYGFSTDLIFLPELKLGVVAVASKDFTNAVVGRMTRHALRSMLAARDGTPLPELETTAPLPPGKARVLAADYRTVARGDRLFVERGARVMEVRVGVEDELVFDSALGYGPRIRLDELRPAVAELPPDIPERWRGLIGEYGWDHNVLFILEKDEKLHALIEWFENYPLEELGEDRFAFPNYGLYHGEELVFERDPSGRTTAVVAASVRFERREVGGGGGTFEGEGEGETFRIEPLRPVAELREAALAASPPPSLPEDQGDLREPELVELVTLDSTIRLDVRYATTNNFMGSVFYDEPRAFLQRPAAEALVRAHHALREHGYGILIHDAYRPWYVTKMFYDATPAAQNIFVANPASGSRHNRGAAADITLYDLSTGAPVRMVGGYDEFSERSFPDYPGGTSRQRWLRELLRKAMEAQGFDVYEFEWWHFDHRDWRKYPILNQTFDQLTPR